MWSFSRLGQKVNKIEPEGYWLSLSYSEAEFEGYSAVSLAISGSISLHFTFYSGKLPSPPLAIVMRVKLC